MVPVTGFFIGVLAQTDRPGPDPVWKSEGERKWYPEKPPKAEIKRAASSPNDRLPSSRRPSSSLPLLPAAENSPKQQNRLRETPEPVFFVSVGLRSVSGHGPSILSQFCSSHPATAPGTIGSLPAVSRLLIPFPFIPIRVFGMLIPLARLFGVAAPGLAIRNLIQCVQFQGREQDHMQAGMAGRTGQALAQHGRGGKSNFLRAGRALACL